MINTLKDLFTSKKFLAMLTGIIAEVGVLVFSGLPEETATTLAGYIVATVGAYLVGQGAADLGKEAKKLEGGAFAEKAKA